MRLITTAAAIGAVTAVGGLTLAARAKESPPVPLPRPEYAPAAS
jgi:hypothetical protein